MTAAKYGEAENREISEMTGKAGYGVCRNNLQYRIL